MYGCVSGICPHLAKTSSSYGAPSRQTLRANDQALHVDEPLVSMWHRRRLGNVTHITVLVAYAIPPNVINIMVLPPFFYFIFAGSHAEDSTIIINVGTAFCQTLRSCGQALQVDELLMSVWIRRRPGNVTHIMVFAYLGR